MTPLHLAASQGHKDVMREIILHCPECYELIDERVWNILHFAMASLNKEELCSLLENPSIKNLSGKRMRTETLLSMCLQPALEPRAQSICWLTSLIKLEVMVAVLLTSKILVLKMHSIAVILSIGDTRSTRSDTIRSPARLGEPVP